MNATTVIRKPVVTEKATIDSNEFNRFTFEIDRRATKAQVKRAVEELYNVRVVGVATQRRQLLADTLHATIEIFFSRADRAVPEHQRTALADLGAQLGQAVRSLDLKDGLARVHRHHEDAAE